jgi:DNA-binding CsgD family transcriptional regulator
MRPTVNLNPQESRVLKMAKAGISQADTARVMGVSRQRVHQIVQRLRLLGELPEERAS